MSAIDDKYAALGGTGGFLGPPAGRAVAGNSAGLSTECIKRLTDRSVDVSGLNSARGTDLQRQHPPAHQFPRRRGSPSRAGEVHLRP
jgi:hypothetical protein